MEEKEIYKGGKDERRVKMGLDMKKIRITLSQSQISSAAF